jgi:hypothetical protein
LTATSREAVVTRYAALTRGQAAAVLVVLLALTAWLLAGARVGAHAPSPSAAGPPRTSDDSDVALYKAVVARVRAGEGYYDAVGAELRGRHYPVRPAFNWRQPTYAWLLAGVPSPLYASELLVLLGALVALMTWRWLQRSEWRRYARVAVALVIVTMASAFVKDFVFLQESWAGFLIALSVWCFALDRWGLGVAAALAALAFRELALLPCAVGLVLALRRHRWPEVAAWLAGLGAYAALMAWHFAEVARHTRPDDLARGWVALGGAAFVLATVQWNSLFLALPAWASAVVLPIVLLGLAGAREAALTRAALIVFGYLLAFSFVGNPFNDYWGAIYAPLLPLGFMAAPASARDLARALTGRRTAAP